LKLKDKVVLITGASKGIGQAIAQGVADEGARVAINYRSDVQGALQTAERIAAMGREEMIVQADIANTEQIRSMMREVVERFGRIDVLINNAGITGWSDLFEVTETVWDEVMNTNLKGTFFCSLEAAKIMKEHGGGSIVNVSTNCAALGVKNLAVYATSKGGIHAMTKQLAVELAPSRIRVNTFAPGPTNVERNLQDDPQYADTWGGVVPMKRTADPREMAGPAIFLASEDSSYMTGQLFYVDGGWTVSGKIPEVNLDAALEKNRGAHP
jgi:NAD(P)-dependent dehydrogenase (short-subunit alcohol dehydrogenase family)